MTRNRRRRATDTAVAWLAALALAIYAIARPRAFRDTIEPATPPAPARDKRHDEHRGRGEQ